MRLPLLLVLLIKHLLISIVIFADDTRLYLGIRKASNQDDLQDDLNTVYSWAIGNNMNFSFDPSLDHTYLTLGGLSIESHSVLKDLGVLLPSTSKHLLYCVKDSPVGF